jgi:branched-chain amino acid aminotransferase
MNPSNEERKVWVNGVFVPEHDARVSIYDSALMFGDVVFEMTRSFNGQQFKLQEHIERLYLGCKILRIPLDMSQEEMLQVCKETIEVNAQLFRDDDEHRLLINVTRGTLGLYQDVVDAHIGTNVIIADFPLRWTVAGTGRFYNSGINAVVSRQRAIPSELLDAKIKNRSRIHYMMANIDVSGYEGDDNWALLLDTDGFVAEGTGANFFIIKDNVLITPEPRNILRGISRDYVINNLAPSLDIQVIEKNIELYDVYGADEAFFTSTPFCMLPVNRLNGEPIGDGRVGPLYTKMLEQWGENTAVDIPGQIKKWNAEGRTESDAPTTYRFRPKK